MSEEWQQLDELWGNVALAAGAAAAPYLLKKVLGPKVDKAIDDARKTSTIGGEKNSN
jgi:hypothetical protein